MRLSEWESEGVDITRFLGTPMWEDSSNTLHGEEHCTENFDDGALPAVLHGAELELCETCWDYALTEPSLADLAYWSHKLYRTPQYLTNAEAVGAGRGGFPMLHDLWEEARECAEHPDLRSWVERTQERILTALREDLPERGPVEGAREAMVHLASNEVRWALGRLPADVLERMALCWAPETDVSGMLLRGPAGELEWLRNRLIKSGMGEMFVRIEILEGESAETIETALSLLDEDSEELWNLTRAFEAARSI